MPVDIPRSRIRITLNADDRTAKLVDKRTNAQPVIWRTNDVQFELAIFFAGLLKVNLNLADIRFDLSDTDRTTPQIATKIVSSFNVLLTDDAWAADTDEYAVITLTGGESGETALDLGDKTQKDFWGCFWSTTQDVPERRITWACGTITVIESGTIGGGIAPEPGPPTSYTKDESDIRFGTNVIKEINEPGATITIKNDNGKGFVLFADENGDPQMSKLQ